MVLLNPIRHMFMHCAIIGSRLLMAQMTRIALRCNRLLTVAVTALILAVLGPLWELNAVTDRWITTGDPVTNV